MRHGENDVRLQALHRTFIYAPLPSIFQTRIAKNFITTVALSICRCGGEPRSEGREVLLIVQYSTAAVLDVIDDIDVHLVRVVGRGLIGCISPVGCRELSLLYDQKL